MGANEPKWHEGQEVRIFDVNGALHGQPEDGYPGEVTKVARKIMHVKGGAGNPERAYPYYMDTGRRADAYGHQTVRTLDEVAERGRIRVAHETLRKHGVRLELSESWPLAKLEAVAATLSNFETGE